MQPTTNIPANPDCEIVSSRTFYAPADILFKAWTDPVHLAAWWGPKGFTNTFHEYNLQPGGTWRFIMHGPDKGHYENEAVFTEIEPPHLLAWYRISKPLFRVQVNFDAVSDHETNLTFLMIFPTPEDRNKVIQFVPEKNEENFDRLEAELKKMRRDS